MKLDKFKDAIAWKGLKSLEFRVLRLGVRAILAFSFVIYLLYAANGAKGWAEVKWIRAQEPSYLNTILRQAEVSGNFIHVDKWLKYRPKSEMADIIARMTPYSGYLPTFTFLEFSVEAQRMGDAEQADLWFMIGLYRLRFDLLRCGLIDAIEKSHELMDIVFDARPEFRRSLTDERRASLAYKVLEFDEKYPAMNNPTAVCRLAGYVTGGDPSVMAPKDWEEYRQGLRIATRIGIEGVAKALAPPAEEKKNGKKKESGK